MPDKPLGTCTRNGLSIRFSVAGDADSYRYLAESIRVHPNQEILSNMLHTAGFGHVDCHNMAAGAVALHIGIKC